MRLYALQPGLLNVLRAVLVVCIVLAYATFYWVMA